MSELKVQPTSLEGLYKVDFKIIDDERGSVMEFYRHSEFTVAGLPSLGERPQINAPLSVKGALRGIHAEEAHKLISVASGKIYAVIVDLHKGSDTAGKWEAFELSRGQGLFVPRGLGNSFQSISDEPSVYLYYFEKEWFPGMPGASCNPLDPDLAINWPIPEGSGMVISEKDRNNPSYKEVMA